MSNPTLHTAALAGLEAAINHALQLDPATRHKLSQLNGHVYHLQLSSPSINIYFIPAENDIRLCGYFEGDADTRLSGNAAEFLKLASASDPASHLINSNLNLHGDSYAMIELQKIARQLDLDWEAAITQLFGDVAGHQISKGLRKGFSFASQAIANLKRQTEEYLKEESDLLAPRWQVEKFYSEVTNLKLRTERLEARINKLKPHL